MRMGASGNSLRHGVMEIAIILLIGGRERDTQRNVAIQATEATLMTDRTLDNTVEDIRLTRVESVAIGESAPYATCRMIFTCEYCYTINI